MKYKKGDIVKYKKGLMFGKTKETTAIVVMIVKHTHSVSEILLDNGDTMMEVA